jgi:hypothetical protein
MLLAMRSRGVAQYRDVAIGSLFLLHDLTAFQSIAHAPHLALP